MTYDVLSYIELTAAIVVSVAGSQKRARRREGKVESEQTIPGRGSPESAAFFRAMLEEIGETQSSLARLMKRKGDDRQPATILRNIQRMANGDARVSGEMRVVLTMMLAGKKKAVKRGERPTDLDPR